MNPITRELYLSVWNDYKPVDHVMVSMHYIETHFQREMIVPALLLLIKKGITGKNFVEWFNTTCRGSNLEMHREIKRMLKKDLYLKPLFAAEDLRA